MGGQLADLDLSARHLNAEAKLCTAQREGYRESGLLGVLVASVRRSLGCGVDPATLGGGVGVDLAFGPEQEEEQYPADDRDEDPADQPVDQHRRDRAGQ